MANTLDGPNRLPQSGGTAKQLVLLLHGFGADGNDLIDLGSNWGTILPDAEFLSPHAPFPCEGAPYGRQWFGFANRTREQVLDGVRQAAGILDRFIDEVLAERKIDESKLALVGFSQGAMMSLFVSLRRAKPVAAVVAYSGRLFAPASLTTEMRARPRILLVHGDADPVVPPDALPEAYATLKAAHVPVEQLLRPGLGHGIDQEGLTAGGAFLRAGFAA